MTKGVKRSSSVPQQPLGVKEPAARAAVVGAAGFSGALAANLLWHHPAVALELVTARSDAGRRLDEVYPRYRVPLRLEEFDATSLTGLDVAVVGYPHGSAASVVAELRGRGLRVVDLSADFRLADVDVYGRWYRQHGAPALLGQAVYGLTELDRERIATADLVANPGCYPTAALLALAPLAKAGLIDDVMIDAKSGISGAGRSPSRLTHFVSADENVRAYSVTGHRHAPEIDQELARLGVEGKCSFVPHLVPLDQGLLASCYVTASHSISSGELEELYADFYAGEPFIEIVDSPPGVREVRDTNFCRIHPTLDEEGGRIYVFASIDNLWKGAAGQAVQNLNLMLGRDETEGLR